ncbi:MAG TPA: hypothetical protein PKY82_00620 [Pyrinomonadaceae bacterium]|nr:hypothetical protein [Pyrinomonadaceae bacterium]
MARTTIEKNFISMRFERDTGNVPVYIKVPDETGEWQQIPINDVFFDENENCYFVKAKIEDDEIMAEEYP